MNVSSQLWEPDGSLCILLHLHWICFNIYLIWVNIYIYIYPRVLLVFNCIIKDTFMVMKEIEVVSVS